MVGLAFDLEGTSPPTIRPLARTNGRVPIGDPLRDGRALHAWPPPRHRKRLGSPIRRNDPVIDLGLAERRVQEHVGGKSSWTGHGR